VKRRFAALIWLALPAAALAAPDIQSPQDLYVAGKYQQAIEAGVAQNTADGFVLAARAELAQELTRPEPCLECLKRAEKFARRAIAADPKIPEGHTYLAITLGYEARIVGIVNARLNGYAEEAKRELDSALAIDPGNPWARAALAGWNIEIVRNGGATLANLMYGATLNAGLGDFAAAFKTQSNNPVLRFQYALTMSRFDLDTYRNEIEDSLKRAASGKVATANDALTRSRAGVLLGLLQKGDMDTYLALVRHYQGYP
jgi:tetratricopeptide (TPR) repeat protein